MNKITHKQVMEALEDFEKDGSKLERVAREVIEEAGLDGAGFEVEMDDSALDGRVTVFLGVESLVWPGVDYQRSALILEVTETGIEVMAGQVLKGHDPVAAAELLVEKLLVPGTFLREEYAMHAGKVS